MLPRWVIPATRRSKLIRVAVLLLMAGGAAAASLACKQSTALQSVRATLDVLVFATGTGGYELYRVDEAAMDARTPVAMLTLYYGVDAKAGPGYCRDCIRRDYWSATTTHWRSDRLDGLTVDEFCLVERTALSRCTRAPLIDVELEEMIMTGTRSRTSPCWLPISYRASGALAGLLFAAAVFSLVVPTKATQRRRAVARGLCPNCRYPRVNAASHCPECGHQPDPREIPPAERASESATPAESR